MAVRNLTIKFLNSRNNVQENVVIDQAPLIDYVVYFFNIDETFLNIEKLQKEAECIFKKLRFAIFNSEQVEKDYKNKINQLNIEIENVRKMFDLKKDIYRKYASSTNLQIIKNMYRQKITRFEKIVNDYQTLKSNYLQHIKSIKEIDNIEIDALNVTNITNPQQKQMDFEINNDIDFEIINERNKEIEELVNSINDLATMFKDLQTLIIEQSEVFDRIDYNMDQAVIKTDKGVEQLKKAEVEQKKCIIQ